MYKIVTRVGLRYFLQKGVKFDLDCLDDDMFEDFALKSTRGKVGFIWKVKSKSKVFFTLCVDYFIAYYRRYSRVYYIHRVFKSEEDMVKFLMSR